jgi:Sulfotransferase family
MEAPCADEPPSQSEELAPKAIYVMGAGRSGSTILGVTLGNCENVFYAGELDKWLTRSGRPKREDPKRTEFWRKVAEGVHGEELFGREAHRFLERSSALFRLRGFAVRRRLRPRYRRITRDLYRSIARTAGVTHVVDSGHYPLRARELQRIEGIELYLIFLVRDPNSIVASFARRDVREPHFSARKTNAYLWLTYLLSLVVFLRHPRERRVLLRHEDLLGNPEGVLRDLLIHLDAASPLPDLSSLSTGFPLQGNRLLDEDVVSFAEPSSSSRHAFSATTVMQLPWAAIFAGLRPIAVATPGNRSGQ